MSAVCRAEPPERLERLRSLTVLVGLLLLVEVSLSLFAVPLLPRWRRDLGLSESEAGIVLGSYSAAMLALSMPVGRLVDRIGARGTTIAAAAGLMLVVPPLAVADSLPALIAVRFVQGAFCALVWSSGVAWIAGRAPDDRRGAAVGTVSAFAAAGTVLGPVVGGPVADHVGLAATTLGVGVLGLAIAVALAPIPAPALPGPDRGAGPKGSVIRRSRVSPSLRSALVIVVVAQTAVAVTVLLTPLLLADRGFSDAEVGTAYGACALLAMPAGLLSGRLGDRRPRLALAVPVALLAAVGPAGLALEPPSDAVLLLLFVAVVGQNALFALALALCSEGAEEAGLGRGAALGLLNAVSAAAALAAPVAAGVTAETVGRPPALAGGAAAALTGAALVARLRRPRTAPAGA